MAVPLLWAAGFGCGDDGPERRPSELLAGWQGPPPRIMITVTGPDADDDTRERCARMARDAGVIVDPSAPIQGILTLSGNNRLQISAGGAIVRNDPKPGWGMDQLCNDALLALLSVARQGPQGGYAPGGYAPPPGGFAGPPAVTVVLTGPAADDGKRERCNRVVTKAGGSVDPNAAVRAVLNLADDNNSLQVISARRGIILNQPKPSWGMEQLCTDAYQAGLSVLQQEMGAGNQPPPGYSQQPPPGYPQQPPPGYPQQPPPGYPPSGSAPPGTVAVSPMQLGPGATKALSELAARGMSDFGRGDYANALVAFVEANHLSNDPAMLFNSGLCYYMLHRPQEALQHMQLYIDHAPAAPNRNQADALIADLHRQLGMDE
jgi:hypothetical protein